MNEISIALAIHSLDPTTNRKNEHPHEIRLENGEKQSTFTVLDFRNQGD